MGGDLIPASGLPSVGDVCLGCVHRPDPHAAHFYWLPEPIVFKRPDDSSATARWFILCKPCHMLQTGSVRDDIAAGRLRVAYDFTWTKEMKVSLKRSS